MRWSCGFRTGFATAPSPASDVRSSCYSTRTFASNRCLTTSSGPLVSPRRNGPSLFKLPGHSSSRCKGRSGTDSDKVLSGQPATGDKVSSPEEGDAIEQTAPLPTLASQLGSGLLLISPFFFWGTSMVAMKELAPHTSPIFVSAFRLLPAGVALVAWAAASGRKQPKGWEAWLACAIFGLVDGTAFQGFLAEGLQRTTAGLGSVIIDSQPLTVAVLAALLFGEKLTAASYAGLGLGVLGLSLLEVPVDVLTAFPQKVLGLLPVAQPDLSQIAGGNVSSSGSLWDTGEWWMLLAAQSMALGTIMVRWVSK
ncbi:TPA: hypothetical protein ACH3X2_009145 [Trebouxia sp. C0005]